MKRLLFILLSIGILGASYVAYGRFSDTLLPDALSRTGSLSRFGEIVSVLSTPTPTPFPFAEMTIPYLRAREYTSELGPQQKVSENAVYTSYTTSYASDGLRVNGYLTIPKGPEPSGGWPAIVFVHGYIPPAQYRTTQNYISYVDYLARQGFVVFKIDLRGHDQSEGEAGGAYYSSDYVIDTLNARAALATSGFVSPEKIGLWGHSMAGNVVMRSIAAIVDIPAVVIWAGAGYTYTDLQTYRISDSSYRPPAATSQRQQQRQRLRDIHGDFDANSSFWKQVAVTDYVTDIQGAIQVHHAVDDVVVSIEYSRNLMNILDSTRVPHELFEYASGGHNLTGPSFTSAMQRSVEFYRKYL
jgi:dipeptidyl aminopeptidase/acylaminoacyl peptidase